MHIVANLVPISKVAPLASFPFAKNLAFVCEQKIRSNGPVKLLESLNGMR